MRPGVRSGIDMSNVDGAVRPQDDLYRHLNGTWLRTAEIPADRPIDGGFHQLRDESEINIRRIIEEAAENPDSTPEARKIGDLYASFMDETTINARGMDPIAQDLAAIDQAQDLRGFQKVMGRLQREGAGGVLAFFVNNDDKDPESYIVNVWQGGLGLPDEAYYSADEHAAIREQYRTHIATMLSLAGIADAKATAERVFALETALAQHHWDRVKCREADLTYNKVSRAELDDLGPAVDWNSWLEGADTPATTLEHVVVRQPSFITGLSEVLSHFPLEDWKAWLTWHVIHDSAPLLSSDLVDENFAFYGTTLSGTPELRERWKRGVGVVEGAMGEALGSLYVARHFPPAAKTKMLDLVAHLIEAYRHSINELEWMGAETRARALQKLEKFNPKIGYPDEFRDYSSLQIDRDDLVGNARRAAAFEWKRDVDKLGKPVDRNEWFMTPQTVNAYYNPGLNEIVFPAAILQPPFFDMDADDAVNYGGIGAVIGHEIGHGFDDQGSKFDGDGNLENWWTDNDRVEFEKRTSSLIAQYDALEPEETPGHKVNGALTIGENIGDLGGLGIAYKAYLLSLNGNEPEVIDGFTGAQRFFMGWAQVWRTKIRAEEAMRRLAIDPHSPAEFRCNQIVRNLDEFYEAFDVSPDDELWLAPEERVRIW
jgi:putative endopeptidase